MRLQKKLLSDIQAYTIVRENVCNKAKTRKKSRFLDFEKNVKNLKNVNVMTCKVLDTTQSVFVL